MPWYVVGPTGTLLPVTPTVVGATGSFKLAFLVAGIVLVVGILFFIFVLGRLTPIPDAPESA